MRESLVARIVGFFERNPDDWLSLDDMAVKFDCTADQAQKALQNALTLGMATKRETLHRLTFDKVKP